MPEYTRLLREFGYVSGGPTADAFLIRYFIGRRSVTSVWLPAQPPFSQSCMSMANWYTDQDAIFRRCVRSDDSSFGGESAAESATTGRLASSNARRASILRWRSPLKRTTPAAIKTPMIMGTTIRMTYRPMSTSCTAFPEFLRSSPARSADTTADAISTQLHLNRNCPC